jgi:hypothetical protein
VPGRERPSPFRLPRPLERALTFTAYAGNEFVEASTGLAELLSVLAEIHSPDVDEDVAVWQGGRLVVVQHPDGPQTWLRAEYRRAEAPVNAA